MSSPFFVNPRSNPELQTLHQILSIPKQKNLQDYFAGVMEILSESFPVKYSVLFLQDSQSNSLHLKALYGVERDLHPLCCHTQKGTMAKVIESRQPMVIHHLNQEPLYEEMLKGQKQIEKVHPPLLCVPLIADHQTMGILNMNSLYSPRDEFIEDFHFLSVLCGILSPVIKYEYLNPNESFQKEKETKSLLLDEILEQKLSEVINKIDPYVETKAQMGLFNDIISLIEKILIKSALERVNHVQTAAAQLLGINRNTLRKKMKELRIKSR